jgi:hypothetical protein
VRRISCYIGKRSWRRPSVRLRTSEACKRNLAKFDDQGKEMDRLNAKLRDPQEREHNLFAELSPACRGADAHDGRSIQLRGTQDRFAGTQHRAAGPQFAGDVARRRHQCFKIVHASQIVYEPGIA